MQLTGSLIFPRHIKKISWSSGSSSISKQDCISFIFEFGITQHTVLHSAGLRIKVNKKTNPDNYKKR
jgi:hypothetical protein